MEILLHTIAIEPARWTPERVSTPLSQLLPAIAESGFRQLEIFEPHLQNEAHWPAIQDGLKTNNIDTVMLSSYVNLRPTATSDNELERQIGRLAHCINVFGFRKVRIFPGVAFDDDSIAIFMRRLRQVADRIPSTEILLETHDGTLADDPARLMMVLEKLSLPKIGLLYQPTFFDAGQSLAQFALEKPFVRHLHLQGRKADQSFVTLRDGLVPWERIIAEIDESVGATLEFVPSALCAPAMFDLAASLKEACAEVAYIREMQKRQCGASPESGSSNICDGRAFKCR